MSIANGRASMRIRGKAIPAVFLVLALVMTLVGSARPADAAVADLLILSTSITKPAADGNLLSVEEQEAVALGLTVEIATPAQWALKTTAQFAAYKALVLGDPTCAGGGTANSSTAAALANKSVWGPAVNGNIAIYGTDPTFHTVFFPKTARPVVNSSINFAASSGPGKTGAYVTLSCYYHGTAANTPVPLLDAFETVPGQFTVTGVGCYNDAHIVATSSALTGLTDAILSNWSCSVHEAFDRWASDFTVLVIARNIGTSYTAPDGSVGTPYVLARGNISAGDISLSPPTQDVCTGGRATVTAKVTSGGTPQSGVTVTFTINSGPNAGLTSTGTTDSSGQVSFTYSGTAAGTDSITASFTDRSGHVQTSKPVTVNWKVCEQPITATGTTFSGTEGQPLVNQLVATFFDPDPLSTAGEYSATIDWGDASSSPPPPVIITQTGASPTGNSFDVRGDHTYTEEGTYTLKVTITDIDTPSNTQTVFSTARIGDAALTARCATPPFSTQTFNGTTATFTDANPFGQKTDFSATINWGDSSSSAGTIGGPPTGPGPYTVSGSHTYASTGMFTITTKINDVGGSSVTVSCSVTIFAFATEKGASFVIGDLEAGLGNNVYWWGSQWANINLMSKGAPPDAMKGFAGFEDNFLGLPPPNCGGTWSTDPGNSTPPPPSVPQIMGVIVSSQVTKSGSVITGDIKQVIIVDNDPGYQPSPGHPGTGKEIGILCTMP
jgi:hypothetical protein